MSQKTWLENSQDRKLKNKQIIYTYPNKHYAIKRTNLYMSEISLL